METSIQVENLVKVYGRLRAINEISFEISKGETIGFLGPNGAGKSTTMRILCGLIPATSGKARIHGVSVARNPYGAKKMIGYLPETNPLPEDMRVIEYLKHRAELKGVPSRKIGKVLEDVMDRCELVRTADKKIIGALSKGYRQRVGIADCLLGDPKVLIMDEPTIGLDPNQILNFRKLVKNLKGRVTLVISSHILPEIEACCERFIIINRGSIVAQGTFDELTGLFSKKVRYHLVLRAPCFMEVQNALSSLSGAETALKIVDKKQEGPIGKFCLELDESILPAEAIYEAIRKNAKWALKEWGAVKPKLEDVFLHATQGHWQQPELY